MKHKYKTEWKDMKSDIKTIEDIEKMVNCFYDFVRGDELLGPLFNERIGDKWPQHLEKMYRFWETVLLDVHSYSGSPFMPHSQMPIGKQHFDRWLNLFEKTIQENFKGAVADDAKERARNMAQMFQHKIAYFQGKIPIK